MPRDRTAGERAGETPSPVRGTAKRGPAAGRGTTATTTDPAAVLATATTTDPAAALATAPATDPTATFATGPATDPTAAPATAQTTDPTAALATAPATDPTATLATGPSANPAAAVLAAGPAGRPPAGRAAGPSAASGLGPVGRAGVSPAADGDTDRRAAAPSGAPGGAAGRASLASGAGAPDAGRAPGGDALAAYLQAQATEFLRSLRAHRESGAGGGGAPEESAEAVRALRRSARRISGTLHTFRPLLDADWSETMRPELAWLSGTLAREHAYASRLEHLLLALHRLSGAAPVPAAAGVGARTAGADTPAGATMPAAPDRAGLTVGAAKAGALLDRQLTLARTRAHSTALQALGSGRFHAVADRVALLASEVPLSPAAADAGLRPLASAAEERLTDAVAALPLVTAGHPYNAAALVHGLAPETAPQPQDAPWHQVRLLLRLHRYAREVLTGAPADVRLRAAGQALTRHRDASEAAAAAAAAARTPRIAPATAYALGVLHADQRHEVEAARFTFHQAWQRPLP
nr:MULTISPECIES: CHAD domain-containing protein [unclassified Streptomyces]